MIRKFETQDLDAAGKEKLTEDGRPSSVLSICKLLLQKWMCHVRRRIFRLRAAEDVKGARRGAADAMVRRAYDEFAQFLHQTVLT